MACQEGCTPEYLLLCVWKGHLFVREFGGIAHTNNSLERVFRKVRRKARCRCSGIATSHQRLPLLLQAVPR
ncbi:MAG: hypothetical protein M1351_01495 [Candidatus Thermoplasmatota archaeon]|nr:hypothetical protein [Candidatus Thermoplasmatota archaeon]